MYLQIIFVENAKCKLMVLGVSLFQFSDGKIKRVWHPKKLVRLFGRL